MSKSSDFSSEFECEERQLLVKSTSADSVSIKMDSGASSSESASETFEELVERALVEDLSDIEDTQCLYTAGRDKQGRAVVVFIGKWFKQRQLDPDRALLYLIRTLRPIADEEYVVLYFHTRTDHRENVPSYRWIKGVYNTLDYKYKKHLKAFYVVHPTLWTKLTCWWFSTFMAPAIKSKIHNVHALEELNVVVDSKNLSIPMFVTEQDMIFNGIRYFQP